MITTIITFLGTTIGRFVIVSVGVLAFLGAFAWKQQNIGAQKVIARSVEAGKRNNEKVQKVREAARKPGAFDRLQRDACRDCR